MRRLTLLFIVLLLSVTLSVSLALAGASGKKCGKDHPTGSYANTCEHCAWTEEEKFECSCLDEHDAPKKTSTDCYVIENCAWKLANKGASFECDFVQ